MKRFATVSGLIAMSALTFGALAGPAQADNNANIQNITVPICADVLALIGQDGAHCNVVDVHSEKGLGTF
ncbi:hypothetical protein [Marinitenerispora sediminis]|uniref:Uncharacterized protein n=1 Tax=Marinitenerispora sediminis TaxID=1931232 RepID=A0A368TAF3_9ACTN|nr:hypothetical protein [Marinitenerispora sediminis]RCV52865.1 hypothetical protein DEF28_11965 [Marinitenerispora sediminis]RCV60041.1 hypothetical protein DEF23_05760 [Marinitenerispora sediminis]RCV61948.1 hypothetical protein DEF24_03065 [Marinitenerispora sediminis]